MSGGRSGFTLVEIMVVVVIIGLLATLAVFNIIGSSQDARKRTTIVQIGNIEQALEMYHLSNGFFPTTDQGIQALVEKAATPPQPNNFPRGGYLKKVPRDGWNRDFIYKCPGDKGDFDIISLGADGREGGDEFDADLSNWDSPQ
ncbi:MAG: type II secretion system major pseudopilin GspG [Synergistaceae bacterium]|jgi:general secretion pathway protein G|nr:type II secretion system major pseudopilin GspG [Synergistaceae bacterium]